MGQPRQPVKPKADGSLYTVVDFSVPKLYPRVGLRTKILSVANRRLTALEGITDTEEAKRRIAYLADAKDDAEELGRIGEMLRVDEYMPALALEAARSELEEINGEEAPDELVKRWQLAPDPLDRAKVLQELGWSEADSWRKLYEANSVVGARVVNPRWLKKNAMPAIDHLVKSLGGDPEKLYEDKASVHKLSDCLSEWEKAKTNMKPLGFKEEQNAFNRWVDWLGIDKPVNRLLKSDFVRYQDHLKSKQGTKTNKWFKANFEPVRRVLTTARGRVDWEKDFPDGLDNWLKIQEKTNTKYKAPASNKRRMPVETFKALLDYAESLKAIDVDKFAATMPINPDKNVKKQKANHPKQAKRLKRTGTMYVAILKLMVNAGLNNKDIAKVTWKDLKDLDGTNPYLDLDRDKPEGSVGAPVPRLTPLLPSTVQALKDWKEFEPLYTPTVFRNDAKRRLRSAIVWTGFNRIRKKTNAGKEFSLRHIRKVGPSVGRNAGCTTDERQAFLGHEAEGTNVFYEEQIDNPQYLVKLINAVGAEYFDGESVGA